MQKDIQSKFKEDLLVELKEEKIILTPQEYTNNVVNYYNSILLILSLMLAAFSFLGFVYIKSLAQDLIDEKLNSDEFKENVAMLLVGKSENRYREIISDVTSDMNDLRNRIAACEEDIMKDDDNDELE